MTRSQRTGILVISVAVAALLLLLYLRHHRHYPTTDDAYVEADIVGIVAQVDGPIVNLPITDNQGVQAGDLLFEVDPRPFRIAVESARAKLDKTGQDVSGSADSVTSAQAGLARAQADYSVVSAPRLRLKGFLTERYLGLRFVRRCAANSLHPRLPQRAPLGRLI